MSNLLPYEHKKVVYKEYWVRVVSVSAILLAVAVATVAVLFFPTFILLSTRIGTLEVNEQKAQASSTVTYKDVKAQLNEATTYARQLDTHSTAFDIAEIIAELDKEGALEITVTDVVLNTGGQEQSTQLQVQGVAQKRDDLAKYVERLKRNPYFSEVKVPVADLAQATESHFTVTIAVKQK